MTPGGQIDASACIAAGGFCASGDVTCSAVAIADCGPAGFCCVPDPVVVTDAGICPDGGIQASHYDQTCMTSSDCVAVAESKTCALCELNCAGAAINVAEISRYNSDGLALVTAAEERCPSSCGDGPGGPCCVGGKCVVGLPCPFPGAPDAGSSDASAE
jgi:hypothetical protein